MNAQGAGIVVVALVAIGKAGLAAESSNAGEAKACIGQTTRSEDNMRTPTERLKIGGGGHFPPGRFNPFRLTDDPLVARILYEIRKEAKDMSQIAIPTDLDESYVLPKLEECKELEMVTEEEGRYIAKFIFLDRQEKRQVAELAEQLGEKELNILRQELPGLISAFDSCSFARQGHDWNQMSHILVGAHLTDMAVMERGLGKYGLAFSETAPQRPGGGRYCLLGVEGGWAEFEFANHVDRRAGWGIWFCGRSDLRPKHTWLQPPEWKLVRHVITEGSDTVEALVQMSAEPSDLVEQRIGDLAQWGWLSRSGETVSVSFPVFYPEDLEIVVNKADQIGSRIVEEVYVPSLGDIANLFSRLRKDLDSERGAFLALVAVWTRELCLAALMQEGFIAALPSASVQQNWAWIGTVENKWP